MSKRIKGFCNAGGKRTYTSKITPGIIPKQKPPETPEERIQRALLPRMVASCHTPDTDTKKQPFNFGFRKVRYPE
ncbi:MAG: hypothetical protein K6G42_10395 [Lachnospiraceae bacterium]|nr:hypothetical protein [Lachnospiraceae bacterium]